jgi:hypothetical protein
MLSKLHPLKEAKSNLQNEAPPQPNSSLSNVSSIYNNAIDPANLKLNIASKLTPNRVTHQLNQIYDKRYQ